MKLFLVRHGQTQWNAQKRLQGQADAPLSDLGREQARALAPLFANGLAPDHVVASDLPRARDTAHILGFPQARLDPRLREMDVGEWTARLIADIRRTDEEAYQGWRAGTYTPDGGESWDAFKSRVLRVIEELVAQDHRTILAVAHGGVIRAACEALVGLRAAHVVPVGPATITIFDIQSRPSGLVAKLEGYNLSGHAPQLDAPD